jgi:hypothetical protein
MREPRLVVIASHNRSKSREIEQLLRAGLADLPVEIRLLADYPERAARPRRERRQLCGQRGDKGACVRRVHPSD